MPFCFDNRCRTGWNVRPEFRIPQRPWSFGRTWRCARPGPCSSLLTLSCCAIQCIVKIPPFSFTHMGTRLHVQTLSTPLANCRPLAMTPSQGVWSVLGRLDPRRRSVKIWKSERALGHLARSPQDCHGLEKEASSSHIPLFYRELYSCPGKTRLRLFLLRVRNQIVLVEVLGKQKNESTTIHHLSMVCGRSSSCVFANLGILVDPSLLFLVACASLQPYPVPLQLSSSKLPPTHTQGSQP